MSKGPNIAYDMETGKSYDVTDPAHPVEVTSSPDIAYDMETGKSYDVTNPAKPVEVKPAIVTTRAVKPVTITPAPVPPAPKPSKAETTVESYLQSKPILAPRDEKYYKRLEDNAKKNQERFNTTIKPYIESIYKPYIAIGTAKTYSDLPAYKEAKIKQENLKTWEELQHWNPDDYEPLTKEQEEFRKGEKPKLTGEEIKLLSKGDKEVSALAKAGKISLHTADLLVPGVWTRHWDKMSTTERAVNAGLDALILVPILGGAIKVTAKANMRAIVKGMVKDFNFNTELNKILRTSARIDDLRALNMKKAWGKIEDAIRRGQEKEIAEQGRLLESAGKLLEQGGVDGGKALTKRGEFLRLNAGDVSRVAKEIKKSPPSSELKKELTKQAEILQNELDAMRRAETRATTTTRKQTLKTARELTEKQLRDLKKKVAVADKTKFQPFLRETVEAGKWLPANVDKATKALSKSKKLIKVGKKQVPVREFATKPLGKIAASHDIGVGELVSAITKSKRELQSDALLIATLIAYPSTITDRKEFTRRVIAAKPKLIEKTKPITKTEAEAKAEAKTKVKGEGAGVGTKVVTKGKGEGETKTETKTKTKPIVIPKIIPKETTKVTEKAVPKLVTKITTKGKGKIVKPPRMKPKVKLGSASDKEKREVLRQAKGLVAWRQGEVDGKDVWHGIKYPYLTSGDFFTLVGRKPTGANIVKGPGSAVETIVLLYGKPPSRTVQLDMGAMDVKVTPKPTVRFKPDPKQLTKGDITIGR